MASTELQCTRDTRDIRDSRYVMPCVCECTSKLDVGSEVIKPLTVGLVVARARYSMLSRDFRC